MNILFRSIREADLENALGLSKQFSLINLPPDKKVIEKKIQKSISSFQASLEKERSKYIFVVEDLETGFIAGSSQVLAKHGSPGRPTYSFEVLKREHFSKDLGVGFIHQLLRLKINEDGPTEVGGLVVDRNYRSRPEKIGKLLSMGRFAYIGMCRDRFEDFVYAQMAPPLTEEGRSEFWEALGRRFTGMPYQEADLLSQKNQEFIRSLFPVEDIYLCLLAPKARLVLGQVGPETRAAKHMLESIGFKYIEEVDPFDGGPHVGCATKDIYPIQHGRMIEVAEGSSVPFQNRAFFGLLRNSEFLGGVSAYSFKADKLILPDKTKRVLDVSSGDQVYYMPMTNSQSGGLNV